MKISTNFYLKEFIDPDTYKKFGDSSIWFIDLRIVQLAQFIRDRFNKPVTINNWTSEGQYKLSGFRPPQSTIGAKLSQHRFGRAIDVKILSLPNKGADEIRKDMIDSFDLYRKFGLTTIEDKEYAPTWCHCDIRWTNSDELLIVKP